MKIFIVQRTLHEADGKINFVANEGVFLDLESAKAHVSDDLCQWSIEEYEILAVDAPKKPLTFNGIHFKENVWIFNP